MMERGYTLGVDIGGTKILSGVVSSDGTVISRVIVPTPKEGNDPDKVIEALELSISRAITDSEVARGELLGIGIGAAGLLDPESGVIYEAPNVSQFKNFNLRVPIEEEFALPCLVENDVNAGTYGEYVAGAGKGAKDLIGIFLGTGIGGGLILNGEIHHGFNKTAGELGHLVVKYDGVPHPLGTAPGGTLEAYAGRVALREAVRRLIGKREPETLIEKYLLGEWVDFDPAALITSLQQADPSLRELLRERARVIGYGIVTLIHAVNPDMFVLGGGLIRALGSFLLPEIVKTVDQTALPSARKGIRIEAARLGDDAALIGSAMLAKKAFMHKIG